MMAAHRQATAMGSASYELFDLLFLGERGTFTVSVVAAPAGVCKAHTLSFPLSGLELDDFQMHGGQGVSPRHLAVEGAKRQTSLPEVAWAKLVGGALFKAAFGGDIAACFGKSLRRARDRRTGLSIRLRLSQAPELACLPWEYLYAEHEDFLALAPDISVVRFLEVESPVPLLKAAPPIRVLAVSSLPSGCPPLDIAREERHLEAALRRLGRRIRLKRLRGVTFHELSRWLRADDFHVLHFMGHGALNAATAETSMVLEDREGSADPADGVKLAILVRSAKELRLVVLNACEGGRATGSDALGGAARGLVRAGVPAVVAMQCEISDPAAATFARGFYAALARTGSVEAAVTAGRLAIFDEHKEAEWGVPVLFLRTPDGQLFHPPRLWRSVACSVAILALLAGGAWWTRPWWGQAFRAVPRQVRAAPPRSVTLCRSPPGLDMKLVRIEAETFTMGSGRGAEKPMHEVTIRRPFCLGMHEVTQEQWTSLMHFNPSRRVGDDLPVENVTWKDVQSFLAKLDELEAGAVYRLPTEAQWEFAARAGSSTKFSFGDDVRDLIACGNCDDQRDGFAESAPVGSFRPNPWGLHDMHGNVSEWVADWYGDYGPDPATDPTGPATGLRRVRRGGSWNIKGEECRTSARNSAEPDYRAGDVGFRVVRELSPGSKPPARPQDARPDVDSDRTTREEISALKAQIERFSRAPEEHGLQATDRSEPTEKEMKEALMKAMQMRGGTIGPNGRISTDNFLNGMTVQFQEFEKVGCKPAVQSVGFSCTYRYLIEMSAHSNEGSAAGDRHSEGINLLLKMTGANRNEGVATKQFYKTASGWVATAD